jgi:aminoglycoside N3'-acetyltransferase
LVAAIRTVAFSGIDVLPIIEQGSPAVIDGERQWVTFYQTDYDQAPFADIGANFEKKYPVATAKVGWATVCAFLIKEAVDSSTCALQES